MFPASFAIPLLERLIGDLAFHKELRELSTLSLTLERHGSSSRATLPDIEACDESILYPKNVDAHRVEQQIALAAPLTPQHQLEPI
jgi:hypothetical protein